MITRAMILAAGLGKRLAPLTDRIPKPLVPVGGRPMIEHLIDFLRLGGITDVVINLHHLGRQIETALGDGTRLGVRIAYSREPDIRDTGGGIRHAQALLDGAPFVVANGDSLLDLALQDVVQTHERRGGIATMVVRPDPDPERWGAIEIDADDRVRRIRGEPRGGNVAGLRSFMFPGLHIFEPEIFDWLEPSGAFSITRVTYPKLLAAERPVHAFVTGARWLTIDTAEALAHADAVLRTDPFRFGAKS